MARYLPLEDFILNQRPQMVQQIANWLEPTPEQYQQTYERTGKQLQPGTGRRIGGMLAEMVLPTEHDILGLGFSPQMMTSEVQRLIAQKGRLPQKLTREAIEHTPEFTDEALRRFDPRVYESIPWIGAAQPSIYTLNKPPARGAWGLVPHMPDEGTVGQLIVPVRGLGRDIAYEYGSTAPQLTLKRMLRGYKPTSMHIHGSGHEFGHNIVEQYLKEEGMDRLVRHLPDRIEFLRGDYTPGGWETYSRAMDETNKMLLEDFKEAVLANPVLRDTYFFMDPNRTGYWMSGSRMPYDELVADYYGAIAAGSDPLGLFPRALPDKEPLLKFLR